MNMKALWEHEHFTVGLMLSTIVIQVGEPPRIFSPTVCQYIDQGFEKCAPTIPNRLVWSSQMKVSGHSFDGSNF